MSAPYEGSATNGFAIFDQRLVQVDTVTAELSVTQPREIAPYVRMFAVLNDQLCSVTARAS